MLKVEYNNQIYTIPELSELSGIAPATIRERLRKGYSVEESLRDNPLHDSVKEFNEASWYEDWIGMSTSYLYEIYWNWCVSAGYTPVSQTSFVREILSIYPNLKCVPTRHKDGTCNRIIRER